MPILLKRKAGSPEHARSALLCSVSQLQKTSNPLKTKPKKKTRKLSLVRLGLYLNIHQDCTCKSTLRDADSSVTVKVALDLWCHTLSSTVWTDSTDHPWLMMRRDESHWDALKAECDLSD